VCCDTWTLLSCLPHLADWLAAAPYLTADPALVSAWSQRITKMASGRGLRIGLNYAGDPLNGRAPQRDIPLAELSPLGQIAGAKLFSLQKSVSYSSADRWIRPADGGHESDPWPGPGPLHRLGPRFEDMADTAAAMMSLDAIVTSDTSLVHLAGALGIRCWLLLDHGYHYLWGVAPGADPSVTPWYSSVRVLRQQQPGQWGPVVAQVADELRQFASRRGAA
jgi:hypothetical protein